MQNLIFLKVKEIQAEKVHTYFLSYYVILINIIFYSSIISLILGLELFHYTKIFKSRRLNVDGYSGSTQETIFSSQVLKMNNQDADCTFLRRKMKINFCCGFYKLKKWKKLRVYRSNPGDKDLCQLFSKARKCRDNLVESYCNLPFGVYENWAKMKDFYKNWNPFCIINDRRSKVRIKFWTSFSILGIFTLELWDFRNFFLEF